MKWLRCGVGVLLAALVVGAHAQAPPASCTPRIEIAQAGRYLRIRPHVDALTACTLDERGYRRVLEGALAQAPRVRTIALGRAVDHPWIVRALIDAAGNDPGWSARRGRPLEGHPNAYVAARLATPPLGPRLAAPLVPFGLRIVGISVEKVLVAPVADVLPARVADRRRLPFDAQIWIELGPAP